MRIAVLALVALAACSSSTDLIDERTLDCDSGGDISVQAGLSDPVLRPTERSDDNPVLLVEVSNNSHGDVTVAFIRVDQISSETASYRLDPARKQFDHLIAENKDHTFEVPMYGRLVPTGINSARRREEVVLAVTVALSSGDSYRCRFVVGSV